MTFALIKLAFQVETFIISTEVLTLSFTSSATTITVTYCKTIIYLE